MKALLQLLHKASVLPASPQTPYAWKRRPSSQSSQTAVYDFHDRTIESRSELYGEAPLLFTTEIGSSRLRWTPRDVTHIYIDVSGSMGAELPWLVGALEPLNRRGLCRLYAFSTVVDTVHCSNGFKKKLANTYGTDINCVFNHLLSFPKATTPGKAVILTDGYTGTPNGELIKEVNQRRVKFYAGLVGEHPSFELQPFVKVIEHLPAFR